MKRLFLLPLLALSLLAASQECPMGKAQSKAKMLALERLMQEYTVENYIDRLELAVAVREGEGEGESYGYGVVALNGSVVVPFDYQWILYERPEDLFLLLTNEGKIGFADLKGRMVIPPQYYNEGVMVGLDYFTDGMMCCMDTGGNYGIIDTAGRVVVPFTYASRLEISALPGMMYCQDEESGSVYMLRFDGDTVMGPFSFISMTSTGLLEVGVGDKRGFCDTSGRVVIPVEYDDYVYFIYGMAIVKRDGEIGVIDTAGRVVVPLSESLYGGTDAHFISPRLLAHFVGERCGVLDLDGREIIPHEYSFCYADSHDRIVMSSENRLYVYDTAGRLLEQYDYQQGWEEPSFSSFGTVVSKEDRWGLVDDDWRVVIPLCYREVEPLDGDHFRVLLDDGRNAIMDSTGAILVSGPYTQIGRLCEGIYSVTSYPNIDADQDALYTLEGLIDLYGNTTFSKKELKRMRHWMKHNNAITQ